MATIISIIISIILILFSYLLLKASQKTKTNEERYLEDIIQMEYLKNYLIKVRKSVFMEKNTK